MQTKELLRLLIKEYGGTQKAFANMVGVSQPSVANWLAQGVIPAKGIEKIMQAIPELDYDYLCGRSEEPRRQEEPTFRGKPVQFFPNLPATCGHVPVGDHDQSSDLIYIPGCDAEAFLPVQGNSMLPTLQGGDIVGVKQLRDVSYIRPNDIYLIYTTENERMLKRIKEVGRGEDLTLHSDNPDYKPFEIRKDSVLNIYRVTCMVRRMG